MEWVNLIVTIITSGIIISLLEFLYYKRFNKAIKKNEANSGDLDNQMKSIDLGRLFLERIQDVNNEQQKLQEQQRLMWEEQNAKREEQWEQQRSTMEDILSTVGDLKAEVETIKEFLDGDYKQFKSSKKVSAKKKVVKDTKVCWVSEVL